MTPNKVRRCRRIISTPGYWRDKAIAEGERYGAIVVDEYIFLDYDKTGANFLNSRSYKRILWYAKHARDEERRANAEKECEKYDYET